MLFLLKDNILRAKTKLPFYYQTLLCSYHHRLRCMKDGRHSDIVFKIEEANISTNG
jgi:hypothetical protein